VRWPDDHWRHEGGEDVSDEPWQDALLRTLRGADVERLRIVVAGTQYDVPIPVGHEIKRLRLQIRDGYCTECGCGAWACESIRCDQRKCCPDCVHNGVSPWPEGGEGMSCPYCDSPFEGSHFGDCRVSENSPSGKGKWGHTAMIPGGFGLLYLARALALHRFRLGDTSARDFARAWRPTPRRLRSLSTQLSREYYAILDRIGAGEQP
jgi:hypothetical protein